MTTIRAYIAAAVVAALLAIAAWWHLSRVHAAEQAVHSHYAAVLADINGKTAAAAAAFRATEQAWQTQSEQESQNGQKRIDDARASAARARTERDGLRADLNRYRAAARAAAHPGAADAGPAAGDAVDLLAELFTRADDAAGELAQAADLARAAGTTCERAYDALTAPTTSGPAHAQAR